MKQDFPASMPVHEQLLRRADAKTPGRKHQHRAGVRASAREKAGHQRELARRLRVIKRFNIEVAAYFRGKRDTYPEKP